MRNETSSAAIPQQEKKITMKYIYMYFILFLERTHFKHVFCKNNATDNIRTGKVGRLFWVQRLFEIVFQSISGRLPDGEGERKEK